MVVFEEIDEIDIVRECPMITVLATPPATSNSSARQGDSNRTMPSSAASSVSVGTGVKNIKILLFPKNTRVTLSGLLNVLDRLGLKEGHVIIIITNTAKSLD